MGNEKEYIEIFDRHRQLIEENSAALLNEKRAEAIQKFKATGFPGRKDEEYLRSDAAKLFAADYGMNLGRIKANAAPHDSFTCEVPNLRAHQEFIVNDSYCPPPANISPMPEGVLLGSLNEFAKTHRELILPYYNAQAGNGDSIAQFNTTFTQDGLFLYIPKGTKVEETIQLVTILHTNIEQMSNRRILIILEEGAEANLLICDHAASDKKTLSLQTAEVFLGRSATLNLFEIEETGYSNNRLSQTYIKQQAGSRLNHCNITLTNGFTRNSTKVTLAGEGAEANLSGLAICDKQQHTDNHTLIEHKVGHCTSNELYKYILDEQSCGVFSGKMLIQPDAQHTISQQTNRNLCLTDCARMYAQPQLEIYADDVKCSHGSTVGQLDNNALFYMQQRGIPLDEARHLLMYAFAGEIIENITIEPIRERLHMLIEKRFRGELNRCKGCTLCKKQL